MGIIDSMLNAHLTQIYDWTKPLHLAKMIVKNLRKRYTEPEVPMEPGEFNHTYSEAHNLQVERHNKTLEEKTNRPQGGN